MGDIRDPIWAPSRSVNLVLPSDLGSMAQTAIRMPLPVHLDWRSRASALDLTKVPDRDLMRGIAEGELDPFACLFDRYAGTATALAQRILRQRHLAEEAVQETFLAVWRFPGRYRVERGSVRSWLMSTVHHRAVDLVRREESHRRRAAKAVAKDSSDVLSADPCEVVAAVIGLAEERKAVRGALADLRPEQRQIIELMYFGALTRRKSLSACRCHSGP